MKHLLNRIYKKLYNEKVNMKKDQKIYKFTESLEVWNKVLTRKQKKHIHS